MSAQEQPTADDLCSRLLEHASLHDGLARHDDDEQRQWAQDLRTAVTLIRERDQYKLAAELNKQTIEAMSRGEYICSNCGIRKDGEHDHAVEF